LVAFARTGAAVEREPYEARSAGIFSVDVRSRRLRRLTGGGLFPNWSPDGRRLAYTLWDVGPSETDRQKSNRYAFLRLVSRAGENVGPGDPFVYAYDVAWAPTGDRLIASQERGELMRIGPPFQPEGPRSIPAAPLPGLLGIYADERDPDWQPLR